MFKTLTSFATVALITLGGSAYAQDDTTTANTSDEPQVGQVYVKDVTGDWQVRCLKIEGDGVEPCQIYQTLNNTDGTPVIEINIFPMPEEHQAAAAATILAPLMSNLQEGIAIQVDDNDARRYPFEFCSTEGCIARIGLTDEELASYKAGAGAIVRIVRANVAPDQAPVLVEMSLTGFTAGFNQATVPQE